MLTRNDDKTASSPPLSDMTVVQPKQNHKPTSPHLLPHLHILHIPPLPFHNLKPPDPPRLLLPICTPPFRQHQTPFLSLIPVPGEVGKGLFLRGRGVGAMFDGRFGQRSGE
ncbi:MAG: hypothetical protein LQ341_000911 [Variospora aurantia]|nr:MAG: hypothetical protein LQ341_000911 [Variospora aurantia]